jgi:hypothetical protein
MRDDADDDEDEWGAVGGMSRRGNRCKVKLSP